MPTHSCTAGERGAAFRKGFEAIRPAPRVERADWQDREKDVGGLLGELRRQASTHIVSAHEMPHDHPMRAAHPYISKHQMAVDC